MDTTRDYYTKWNKSEKDKYMYCLYVESKIWHKGTLSTKEKQTYRYREQICSCRGGGGIYWEFGISKCKLVYTGWINNRVLLRSTGNYIQYPVINHNGEEYEKEWKKFLIEKNAPSPIANVYPTAIGEWSLERKSAREIHL